MMRRDDQARFTGGREELRIEGALLGAVVPDDPGSARVLVSQPSQ